jgi:hypothetical protein
MVMGTAEYVVRRPRDLPGNRFAIRAHRLGKSGKPPFQPQLRLFEYVTGMFGNFRRSINYGVSVRIL